MQTVILFDLGSLKQKSITFSIHKFMNLPFNIKQENGKQYIFDSNRKKYVVLTPEEWVRQQVLFYLISELNYPSALISVEKQIIVGTRKRRYDIVIYKNDQPYIIVECKQENENLNEQTLSQLLAYNSVLKVDYLCITNGKQSMTYDVNQAKWMNGFPAYL